MLPWRHNWSQTGLDTVSLLSSRNTSFCLNLVMEKGSVCVLTLDSVVDVCGSKHLTQGHWIIRCFSKELHNVLLSSLTRSWYKRQLSLFPWRLARNLFFIECDSCFCYNLLTTLATATIACTLLNALSLTDSHTLFLPLMVLTHQGDSRPLAKVGPTMSAHRPSFLRCVPKLQPLVPKNEANAEVQQIVVHQVATWGWLPC